jgi:site-specific DNA-methyltransferase (adenine-specific)
MTVQVANGDCLELMKSLPDKSIDLFVCDLPYGETACSWDSVIDLAEFWKQFKRLRKSKRTACIHFCSTKFGFSLIKSWEKGFKMDMVYKKRHKTGGLAAKYRPLRQHEMVYFFYEQAPLYNRDTYHTRVVPANVYVHAASDCYQAVTAGGTSKMLAGDYLSTKFSPPHPASVFESTKVWTCTKRHHQTEKPQDILEFFLKYWSDEGHTVLDPTMGSGSTGVACQKLGRDFIGYELNAEIYAKACERLEVEP